MKKIDDGHYKCPRCLGVFPIGTLYLNKSGKDKGKPQSLCKACHIADLKIGIRRRASNTSQAIEDKKQSIARKKIEELREQKEIQNEA